jgi:uncharacterized membrane protein
VVWAGFYIWRAWRANAALETNAYDLSLFDYTLWSTLQGRPGFVPFMHSIFAHHVMPVILLVAPIYAIWPSPEWVIAIHTIALAAGALVFFAVARRLGLGRWPALALMFVLLISRRSHSASVSYFYFESLQPLLMFTLVLAWLNQRWRLFWIAAALLLTTKEDMPLYLVAFAALHWIGAPQHRTRLAMLAGVSAVWFVAAFTIAIPFARSLEGHSTTNPFFESRFGAVGSGAAAVTVLAGRIFSVASFKTVFSVIASAGLISLAAPRLLLVAAPALLICLATATGNMQNAVLGHYALPVLPWVFVSAAAGVVWLTERSPTLARVFLIALVAGTLADAPIVRYGGNTAINPDAAEVLRQFPPLEGDVIAMQPNLIPHAPHSMAIRSLEDHVLASQPDAVWLTTVGNAWPLDADGIAALIARYQADAAYEQVRGGPLLYVFRRRK